jgi:hypothetical protein
VYAVLLGTLVLISGHMNRANVDEKRRFRWLFLYVGGVMMVLGMVVLMELTSRALLHNALPYILVSIPAPVIMAVNSRATGVKFAATFVTGFYSLFLIGLILLLPLFPAEPKLGPVYQHITHFIPPQFPLLLVVPALILDLFWSRTKMWAPWKVATLSALIFVGSLLAVEWPFASFLQSPASRNRFFGTTYFAYGVPPGSYSFRGLFYLTDTRAQFLIGIVIAVAVCTLTIRFGISRGEWMGKIRR